MKLKCWVISLAVSRCLDRHATLLSTKCCVTTQVGTRARGCKRSRILDVTVEMRPYNADFPAILQTSYEEGIFLNDPYTQLGLGT